MKEALKHPIEEAHFSSDMSSALSLYNSIKFPLKNKQSSAMSFDRNKKVIISKYKPAADSDDEEALSFYRKENETLRMRFNQSEADNEIIRWYIQVMEEDENTKDIVKNYLKLKEVLKQSQILSDKQQEKYDFELKYNREKLAEVHK